MGRIRTVTALLPAETGRHDGLAYTLWLPEPAQRRGDGAGVVILHGAGSCKESHHDYARLVRAAGFAAVCFDARGHGESDGPMDGRAALDVATMADLVRDRVGHGNMAGRAPVILRGSSMGGYLALVAAASTPARPAAIVAICPAPASGLRSGLAKGRFDFDADREAVDAFLAEHDETEAVDELDVPVLLLHAEGDEQVPVDLSRALEQHLRHPASRLITVPGGHHRSVQHDGELQAISLRFVERALLQ